MITANFQRHLVIPTVFVGACLLFGGCATSQNQLLENDQSQVKLRSMQTRAFDTTDKEKLLRTIIATLQDLNFVIQKTDADLGTVTAEKFINNQVLTLTATVRPRGEKQLLVRANAQYGIKPIDDPVTYQDFFTGLEKAIFLTAQQVEEITYTPQTANQLKGLHVH